jgi:hypothetical protein
MILEPGVDPLARGRESAVRGAGIAAGSGRQR